jgi:predicted RecA/RadA family phage recombinase
MALSANREVDHFVDQELRSVAVSAGAHIFKGALVEWNVGGYAQPVTGAGVFAGLAYEEMDNTDGANGAVSGRVYTLGDFEMPLAGAAAADVGKAAYASDDETLTLTAAGNVLVGRVRGVPSSGRIILRLAEGAV